MITLLAPTGDNIPTTIQALEKCYKAMEFASIKLVTHEKPKNLPHYITFEPSSFVMDTYKKYNEYVFRELGKHVDTSHCLLVQYDSWILRPELWDDAWLEWDYIGAPWPIKENSYIANTGERVRVGNGGFSLRSKRLLDIPKAYDLPLMQEQGYYNEDGNVTCYHRRELLALGIKYAPIEVAARFSHETDVPENDGILPFGFHRFPK
jgi:hypothetical protein